MKRIDYSFVQNKICQQPISTAAEPSKQCAVPIDACEHPVDKGNVDDHESITDTFGGKSDDLKDDFIEV